MAAFDILRSRCSTLALLVLLSLAPARAGAQPGPDDAPPQKTEFDRVLAQALTEFELGNWSEARSLFERGHELRPSARTLRAIAACAFEQRLYVDAISYAQQALAEPRKSLDAKQKKEMEQLLERAYGFVAQFELVVTPVDAQVTVDLKPPTIVASKLLLDPGEHEIHVSARGFEDSHHRFAAQPRESRTITIKLNPVEGESQAKANAGTNTQMVSSPVPNTGWRLHRKVGLGVGAAGLASLGASLTFALVAKAKHDDAGCTSTGCADASAKRSNDRAVTFANASTGTAIAGAAVLGAGAAMFFWPEKWTSRGDVALKVSPALASGYSGASLEVVW